MADDIVLGDIASTKGVAEALASAGLVGFAATARSRILRDDEHRTFAVTGLGRTAGGDGRTVAVSGRTGVDGASVVQRIEERDETRDPSPDATARRALKLANRDARVADLVEAAGGPTLTLALTRSEVERASMQTPATDSGTPHERLLAFAQPHVRVATWGRGSPGTPDRPTGEKSGRDGLEYLASTFGRGLYRRLTLDVEALAARVEPEQMTRAAGLLKQAVGADAARQDSLRRNAAAVPAPARTDRGREM